MLHFAPPLISLFLFTGFAIAGLVAPDCTAPALQWVRMSSFLHSILWLLTDLVVFPPVNQFSWARCLYNCSVHVFYMPWGL